MFCFWLFSYNRILGVVSRLKKIGRLSIRKMRKMGRN